MTITKVGVKIGPQETRRITFEARAMPGILPGKFRIDVEARQSTPSSPAKDTVYVTVKED